jgi:hypothetical protein
MPYQFDTTAAGLYQKKELKLYLDFVADMFHFLDKIVYFCAASFVKM